MKTEIMGSLSGALVLVSGSFYIVRTWQRKIHPNFVSFSLWTFIGLALLLTYKSSGAKDNVWPAVFGFVNPILITIGVVVKDGIAWKKFKKLEWTCLITGAISIAMWIMMRQSQELAQYALYVAIIADIIASIPTLQFVWNETWGDRPGAWILFAVGYGLAIFAVPEKTFANYILPIYMFFLGLAIALPLAFCRYLARAPWKEWF